MPLLKNFMLILLLNVTKKGFGRGEYVIETHEIGDVAKWDMDIRFKVSDVLDHGLVEEWM